MKKVLVPMAIYYDTPIIGIHGIRPTYIQKLIQYNLLPIFITPLMTEEQIEKLYSECQGVYFIGGDDFDPKLYGQKKHPKTTVSEATRDILEIKLLKKVLKDKKPFLGICRGMQALAIASDGSLFQHIPDMVKGENHNPNKNYDDLLSSNKHEVIIEKDSQVFKIIKRDRIKVKSYHHQAVDNLGKEIKVVGKSPAGVIEVIEHRQANYFCIGIQGHPEAEEKGAFEAIFKEFARRLV